jgi:predicted transcriptional regulator
MELILSDAQEAKLQLIAERAGKSTTDLLIEAATSVIEIDEHHWIAIDRAIAQADRGEFIEEEEMDARVAKMLAR